MEDERVDVEQRLARVAELISSSPHNLVSRGERPLVASVHVPEAAALLPHLGLEPGQTWLDLGTGGGLPGLVLAILAPEVRWILLDSTRKKVEAVDSFVADLGLANVETRIARAEDCAREPELRGRLHGVVARAVAPLLIVAELARGFVRPGGLLAAVKGPAWQEEVTAATPALAQLRWSSSSAVHIASAVRPTWLVSMRAQGPPPAAYPRRVGVPRQDPLGRR